MFLTLDPHSQNVIASAFERIEKEICVKFFNTPLNYTATENEKLLYISNPDKRKSCPPEQYDYSKSVVQSEIRPSTILSATDRNFINANYHEECGGLVRPQDTRRSNGGTMEITAENENYYKDKLWPLGIVMYGATELLQDTAEFAMLQQAMTVIEVSSCVVFQQVTEGGVLQPKNLLWFSYTGEEHPNLGFTAGNQTIMLMTMVRGAPGHISHVLNQLFRVLGIPMMSNRFDRDNYITVNWRNVEKTKEHYLERAPRAAWLRNTEGEGAAYDYDSVTHAPANFMCNDCSLGAQTVQPIQDHLWQRTMTMGHRTDLSPLDVELLNLLYSRQCQHRFLSNS
ncbi:unnamed protein product [Chrysodeixis includens]|uniref:Metalloendopeptidase n=1 Tax=Chrysodeixis includens TaxID=689277 RepID=A0A9P0C2E0_CHRIL|nr:unnamed protein product [Chrysodeixis includens]